MIRIFSLLAGLSFTILACETSETIIDPLDQQPPVMSFSVSEVSQIRSSHNLDQRAMEIEGVLSVGTSGKSSDDAWIQILCLNEAAVTAARTALGDSVAGVPIHFMLSDTIRAH